MSKLILTTPPAEKAAWEIFEDDDEKLGLARGFVAEKRTMPAREHLQGFARSQGKSLPFSAVATTLKTFRTKLMDGIVNTNVKVCDAYNAESTGTLRAWSEKNDRWSIDFWTKDGKRFNFTSAKQPVIEVQKSLGLGLSPLESILIV